MASSAPWQGPASASASKSPSQGSQIRLQAVGNVCLESGSLTSRRTGRRGGRRCEDSTWKGLPQSAVLGGSEQDSFWGVKVTSAVNSQPHRQLLACPEQTDHYWVTVLGSSFISLLILQSWERPLGKTCLRTHTDFNPSSGISLGEGKGLFLAQGRQVIWHESNTGRSWEMNVSGRLGPD